MCTEPGLQSCCIIDMNITEGSISDQREESPGQPTQRPEEPRPEDAGGEAAVRLNALKHGLRSRGDPPAGRGWGSPEGAGERLRDELQPVGELENLLVDRIVAAYWRLRRLGRVEAGIFAWELYGEWAMRARQEAGSYTKQEGGYEEIFPDPFPRTTRITDQEKHQEAISRAREMEAKRKAETATLGRTFIRDADGANAFSKLSRYETAIERSLYKALHELQRLQAARRADGSAPPPVAIDVDISGVSSDEH